MPSVQASSARDEQSTTQLIKRGLDEIATLFREELALASAEITAGVKQVISGAVSIGAGAAILYAGLLTLIASGVLALSQVLSPWLSALLIGAGASVAGIVLLMVGKKAAQASKLTPRRAAASLREDKDVLMRKSP